jgi:hypothetical protein
MSVLSPQHTQSAYNAGDENEDSSVYGAHGSSTDSGSVDPQDLNKAQSMTDEGQKATSAANSGLDKRGFGA